MRFSRVPSLIWLVFACQPVWSNPTPIGVDDLAPTDGFVSVATRLSAEEVRATKRDLTSPPGTVLDYVSLPVDPERLSTNETMLVPVIQGDPDVFLDDEDGVQARSLAARQSGSCIVWSRVSGSCSLTYCWSGTGGVYTAHVTIEGSNGQSNPSDMSSSNGFYLVNWPFWNNGWGGWFPARHECSNGDTQVGTLHRINSEGGPLEQGQNAAGAVVDYLQCNNCVFSGIKCQGVLIDNLLAFTNGASTGVECTEAVQF